MPGLTQLRAIIAGACVLVVLIIAGLIYWRGSSNQATKTDLRVARETIKVERETLKITSEIHMRVDLEGFQTAQTAEAATNEIERIRTARAPSASVDAGDPASPAEIGDPGTARILQLAREARAAAIQSAARLRATDGRP